ncbi:hypothetical protein [Prevotella lacticifex]|uniref:hypothetical protein n=1 Tax=Prevotella lacticifex TaxID=2854755 RepID=UPI001CC3CC83|nr:hypothetical protein [Prevotella lacticifex]
MMKATRRKPLSILGEGFLCPFVSIILFFMTIGGGSRNDNSSPATIGANEPERLKVRNENKERD